MDYVPVAEAMGVVVSDDRLPLVAVPDLELHRVVDNASASPMIRATKSNFVGDEVNQPGTDHQFRVAHILVLARLSVDTVQQRATAPVREELLSATQQRGAYSIVCGHCAARNPAEPVKPTVE